MSLIKTYTADTAGHQAELKDRVSTSLSLALNNMKNNLQNNYAAIWHNGNLTPQECFDAFGVDAHSLLTISASVKTLILVLDPNYVPLVPPHHLIVNDDGTVTVGDVI